MKPTNALKQLSLPELFQLYHVLSKLIDAPCITLSRLTHKCMLVVEEIDKRIFFGE